MVLSHESHVRADIHRDGVENSGYQGLGKESNKELLFNRYRVSVCEDGGSGEEGGERYTMNILKV